MVAAPTATNADDEQPLNANAYDAISPNGQWLVSSELAPVTGEPRVEGVPPSPCNVNVTVYTLRKD